MAVQFATTTEMLRFFDARRIGELVRDDETTVSAPDLITDAVLLEHLYAASSEVLMACREGRRYTKDNLDDLEDDEGRLMLVKLTCRLAMASLLERRQYDVAQIRSMVPGYGQAMEMLDRLRRGEMVFDLDDSTAATLIGQTKYGSINQDKLTTQAHRLFAAPPGASAGWED